MRDWSPSGKLRCGGHGAGAAFVVAVGRRVAHAGRTQTERLAVESTWDSPLSLLRRQLR
jgi:hypothetical protein